MCRRTDNRRNEAAAVSGGSNDVLISEVGYRDDLKSVRSNTPPALKKRLIAPLYDAGVRDIVGLLKA